jgi:hypothetical protein
VKLAKAAAQVIATQGAPSRAPPKPVEDQPEEPALPEPPVAEAEAEPEPAYTEPEAYNEPEEASEHHHNEDDTDNYDGSHE